MKTFSIMTGWVVFSLGAQMTLAAETNHFWTDVKMGKGKVAVAGKSISVQYTGWLYDPSKKDHKGEMFDSSKNRLDSSTGKPQAFVFTLGAGRVIPGWDKGFEGMKEGGKRILDLPPELAYGERGAGDKIPPHSRLLFEVELEKVN